ncbi:sodium-coupled monocarboxylate transporter 1 isoform X3 [Phyllopteryx taeniolatus]|uniref:sodium-coupled monocarboxylate transporter 1 isoform X3 n=1 Tax=Phyllopteryx taeniolatus TaxID=161469 RepID=UPI002AD288F9|nr:sodium-coupled monocarboxylate transporter 1 isoform X3 [Phyllopteryx taeniolatus]
MVGTGGPVATFSVWDYVVFAGTIVGAAGIGLFQAFRGRKEASSAEFFLGGRQMTAVPVAMSLTASFMSGVTVIGTPVEAYLYGTSFWLFGISYVIMSTITAEIFVPLFYRLGITSAYEYLEMRFNWYIRIFGTLMYTIQTILYTALVIYAPALALNQITGMDLWGVLVATGAVCIFYCTLGGLKAVIWTDVLQMVIMLAGFVAVIARGAVLQGGLDKIWEDASQGGRLKAFDFDPDPLKRHTFWSILIGGSVTWMSVYSINQSQVQRYISCKTLRHAKMSLYVNMAGLCVTLSLAMLSGLTMFSIYKNCDPFTNGDVGSTDQLLPYLVMDILAVYPGIPGLFVAAAYSGTLSTVSSSINGLVAVTMEDFIRFMFKNLTVKQTSWMNMGLRRLFRNGSEPGVDTVGVDRRTDLPADDSKDKPSAGQHRGLQQHTPVQHDHSSVLDHSSHTHAATRCEASFGRLVVLSVLPLHRLPGYTDHHRDGPLGERDDRWLQARQAKLPTICAEKQLGVFQMQQ